MVHKKEFQKPYKTHKEQVDILKNRGLSIPNEEEAIGRLETIGYYRLSSYWYHLEKKSEDNIRTHTFKPNTDFNQLIDLYVFDQKMRFLIIEGIERIEITLRALWADAIAASHGSHGHTDSTLFNSKQKHCETLKRMNEDIDRSKKFSNEIRHYLENYEPDTPPVWMCISALSFGELVNWISNTDTKKVPIKQKIALRLGLPSNQVLNSVLKRLNIIRNLCAHHERIWDRVISTKSKKIKGLNLEIVDNQVDGHLYNNLLIICYILLKISPKSTLPKRISERVKALESAMGSDFLKIMHFPKNWENEPPWNGKNI